MAGYTISERAWREIQRIRRLVLTMSGPGVTVGADSITILPPTQAETGPPPRNWFYARITGHTNVSAFQWNYDFEEVYKSGKGYNAWAPLTNGRTGKAWNFVEDQQGAGSVLGNGATFANLAGLVPQPVPIGLRVRMEIVPVQLRGEPVEYWFEVVPGLDGNCL